MANAMRVLLAGAMLAGTAAPVLAQQTIQPIVIRDAKGFPGCQIYLKADGSRLLYRQQPITPGGACPAEFVRGRVTRFGANSYRLEGQGLDCVITPEGKGRCTREPPRKEPAAPGPSQPLPKPG